MPENMKELQTLRSRYRLNWHFNTLKFADHHVYCLRYTHEKKRNKQ